MIRPLTIATVLLACGSGLYLYQSKHEVQLLDRTIEKAVRDTGALREQSRLLSTEWNMLNDPERLRQFSDTYLNLKAINPAQYTSLADLTFKLPAPQTEPPAHTDGDQDPSAIEPAPQSMPEPAVAAVVPPPVVPPATEKAPQGSRRPAAAVASVARPPELKMAASRPTGSDIQSRPAATSDSRPIEQRLSEQRGPEQRPTDQHTADQRAEQHPLARSAEAHADVRSSSPPPPRPIILAAPRPQPSPAPQQTVLPAAPPVARAEPLRPPAAVAAPAPAPYGGSLLGMARGSMPPVPRPMPVNATYNGN
jgi:hypothetical protein